MSTLRYVISLVLGIGVTYAVQRWDRAHLTPRQRERAWNTASWGAALYAFGPLSMIGWVCVTRVVAAPWWPKSGVAAAAAAVAVFMTGVLAGALLTLLVFGVDVLIARLAGVAD